jgi:ABC-type transport system involved in cytochrome c biogenesis permease subunit
MSIALALYSLTSIAFVTYLFIRTPALALLARLLFIAGALTHLASTIMLGIDLQGLPLASIPQALNMMILFATLVFIPIVLRGRTTSLGAFFMPLATFALALIAPSTGLKGPLIPHERFWYPLHTLTVIIGESLFLVATVASIVYLVHERLIRQGDIHTPATGLPPLTMLDRILMTSLSLGFIAITLGMLLGSFWAAAAGITRASMAPKIAAGAIMWVVFAFSLHQRFAIGWQGRRTAVITIIGCLIMIMFFVGLQILYPHAHGLGILP